MILEAVQILRYKNGLFVTSITPRTDLVNDMTIMINSAQVTGLDNMRLQNVKAAVEEIKRRVAAGETIGKTVMGKQLTIYDFYGQHVGELRVSTPQKLFHSSFGSGCCLRSVYDYLAVCTDMFDHADLSHQDILLSRDKHEHARWLKYYGGGGSGNDGNNGGSGSAVA